MFFPAGTRGRRLLLVAAIPLVLLSLSTARAQPPDLPPPSAEYVRGYAAAVLEREFGLKEARVALRDGTLTVRTGPLPPGVRERLLKALRALPGVARAEVAEQTGTPPSQAAAAPAEEPRQSEFLPRSDLFAPLIADPRWPHFSLGYQNYFDDPNFRNVFAPSFGETFPFVRFPAPGGQAQLGVHAAVFPIFDLDADSFDLINADYWVGGAAEYRRGPLSALFRVFHQSSHLGDEFLLRAPQNQRNRVNLSYEAAGLLLSVELFEGTLRLYSGGEYLFHRVPSDLRPWTVQYGAEFHSPAAFLGGWLRPVAGLDIKNAEEAGWDTNLSVRAGVQIEGLDPRERRIQLMLEYFTGRSPNGQFYDETIKYFGVGLHFYF